MQVLAPGSVVFHRYRGFGVITNLNLLTGWITVRFGNEKRALDLNLSSDSVLYANGAPIMFRKDPPERMPHARIMRMVQALHQAGYQKLYLFIWPKPSQLHWNWHLFTGPRKWLDRPWRDGWHGSGAEYIFNPVMGWGDSPGATTPELVNALAQFDPAGLAQALGKDEDYAAWFSMVCDALLPNYVFSLECNPHHLLDSHLKVIPIKNGIPPYDGPPLPWPPGWDKIWGIQKEFVLQPEKKLTTVLPFLQDQDKAI